MAVEQNSCLWPPPPHQRYARSQQIYEECLRVEPSEFLAPSYRDEEMHVAEDSKENFETTEKSGGEEPVPTYADIESAWVSPSALRG